MNPISRDVAMMKKLVVFSSYLLAICAIAGCVPTWSVKYEIESPVGHGTNWNCDGSGGPTTALTFKESGIRFTVGVDDQSPSQLGISIWIKRNQSMHINWREIKVLSDDGEKLTNATSIYRRNLQNQNREKLSDQNINLSADSSANAIYVIVVKPIKAGMPKSFFIVIPKRRIGNTQFPSFRAHFKETAGWAISPVNC